MADNDEFDGQNDGQEGDGKSGKGLRAQLEAALAKIKELETSNSELVGRVRSTDLAELLKSNGARAGAEKLYPKDAEVSEDAVKAWVEENAAFVRDEGGDNGSGDDGIPAETKVNSQRLAALADGASQRPAGDISNIVEQIKAAKTPEELSAIYAQIGLKRE